MDRIFDLFECFPRLGLGLIIERHLSDFTEAGGAHAQQFFQLKQAIQSAPRH